MSEFSGDIRVLYVDEEPNFADVAATYIQRENDRITVETAPSASEGVDRLVDDDFDCIISDYDMPDQDGIEFLESVREGHPDLPFILFTGAGSEEVASDAISAGVTDYLQKESGVGQYAILANRVQNAVERYQAQREVRRARSRLQRTYERITDGFFAVDTDWRYTHVNEEGAQLVGRSKDELLGRSVWKCFPQLLDTPFEDALRTAMETRQTTTVEAYYPVHDTWYDVRVYSDTDGISIYFRDVTDRKAHERRFEAIFENPLTVIGLISPDGTLLEVNRTAVDLVDEPAETITGEAFWETPWWAHSDELQEQLQNRIARAADGEHVRYEAKHPTPEGGMATIDGVIHPVRDGESVTELVAIGRDITEQRKREEAITNLHEVATDLTGRATRRDIYGRTIEAAESLLEFDRAAIAIEEDGLLHVKEMSEEVPLEDQPTLAVDEGIAGKTYQSEESFLLADVDAVEEARPQTDVGAAISIPVGDHGVFQVIDDTTGAFDEQDRELAELLVRHTESALDLLDREMQLERQNERLEEFTSVVSHDLRNPLTVADGRLELARDERDSEHLDAIADAIDRMDALIEDLLTVARQGEAAADREPLRFDLVTRRCWENVETAEATLTVATDRRIKADENRLRQLLENLFRNAIEHGGADVAVTVGDVDGGLFVEDDGPGIPFDQRERAFDHGYSTSRDGTGLGLSIVERVADEHDWDVRVAEGTDGGARFEIVGAAFADR